MQVFARLLVGSAVFARVIVFSIPCPGGQEKADQYPHLEKETQQNVPPLHFAPPSSAPTDVIPIEWESGAACGANCMYLLLNLEHQPATLDELRAQLPTTGRGASMAELADCASRHGLKTRILQVSPRGLVSCRFPMIVRMGTEDMRDDAHYMLVLRATKEGQVEAIDGTSGQQFVLPASVFNKHFTGYVLIVNISTRAALLKYLLIFTVCVELVAMIYLGGRMVSRR
jgi:hypothetical protein